MKKYHIEIANNNAYMTIVTYNNDKETSYYGRLIEAGLYVWEFSSREDTTATVSPRVAKSDDLVSIANLFSDYGIKLENSYDSFAFNKDTERYEASNIALENASFSHISMKIEKSKILELEAVKNDEAKVSLSFRLSSYGTTKINPPKAQ